MIIFNYLIVAQEKLSVITNDNFMNAKVVVFIKNFPIGINEYFFITVHLSLFSSSGRVFLPIFQHPAIFVQVHHLQP